ncbi:MAG: ATP-binding cassette domain-containing protein [Epsilonproteobacteria bacterium]|nr:ATP-binding cassette domain-containing protein [Campylobacterota bacterium]
MVFIDIGKKLHGIGGEMELKVSLSIKRGEFLVVTGKSGSGKTTFLRILAGLERGGGVIEVDGEIWQNEKVFLKPQKREIGFVFQDYALFPNMSVLGNLLYVRNDIPLARRLLEITDLLDLSDRLPATLSGGQKQRVALCRALMKRPKLLLMDEPLSALDMDMRIKLQKEISLLHKEFKTTTIMVSHDPSEIYRLADRVVVLEFGEIIKEGSAKELFLKESDKKLFFWGEVLDILKREGESRAVVFVEGKIVLIPISKERVSDLQIGRKIKIGVDASTLFIA